MIVARRALLIAAAVQPDSLDMVLTRLLVSFQSQVMNGISQMRAQSARFLTFDRRITECWSQLGAAVRTAQALGLHRDGASMVSDLVSDCDHVLNYAHRACLRAQSNTGAGFGMYYLILQ